MIYRVRGDNVRLVKFRSNNKLEIVIACFLFVIIIFISLMFYFKSYAVFREEKHFNVINGEVQDPGDIYFAYYVDDEITREIPKKGSGYTLDITKSNCTNGVTISFDENNYAVITSYENYNATEYARTRCDLYFKKVKNLLFIDYINGLVSPLNETLMYDNTVDNNLRYIGADPNNYILIDGELWRIIGVMNNISDSTGNKEARLKIIRNDTIGMASWDSSTISVNEGYGVNEWSQADLMKILNPGFENQSIGGSLYYNMGTGKCYSSKLNNSAVCDFTTTGLKSDLKDLVDTIIWNVGSNGKVVTYDKVTVSRFYELERSTNTGKICSSTTSSVCTDTVKRTTTWTGKVGLMYPSDYGYSTSGGDIGLEACQNTYLYLWNNYPQCYSYSWLYSGINEWTMMPLAFNNDGGGSNAAFYLRENYIFKNSTAGYFNIRPVVYLKRTVKIVSGIGTKENPFVIGN